ncbi:hypothetical protein BC829DRAFT_399644, partial [Chytridium lagenaria]
MLASLSTDGKEEEPKEMFWTQGWGQGWRAGLRRSWERPVKGVEVGKVFGKWRWEEADLGRFEGVEDGGKGVVAVNSVMRYFDEDQNWKGFDMVRFSLSPPFFAFFHIFPLLTQSYHIVVFC